MMLFATIVKQNRDKAWKSLRHEDGELCFGGGWFIVGIDTPEGSYTYHYEDNFFSLFDCVELERSKHWDGHTEKDVTRLLSLSAGKDTNVSSDDTISRQAAIDIVQGYTEQLQRYIGMSNDSEVYAYARGLLLSIDRNIKALQSAQPERKKGKWIKGVCSECGYDWSKDAPISSVPNFCPNCGAEMRDKQDIYCKENIEESPTVDFTICKYCKYHIQEDDYWYCNKWQRETKKDWACSRGGKKE